MKTIAKKNIILLLMVCLAALPAFSARQNDFSKTIHKEFHINKGALLNINTEFSDIKAINWDKDMISVETIITVDARKMDMAEEKFHKVDIEILGNETEVSITTKLQKNFFKHNNNNNNIDIEIIIYYPSHIRLNLESSFGNSIFENIEGPVEIEMSYGNFDAKELLSNELNIDMEFGKFEVDRFQAGEAEVSYGGFSADIVGILNLDSEFSTNDIELVDQLEMSSAYDKIYIGQTGSSSIESEFSSVKIDKLEKYLQLTTSYGSFKLRDIAKGFDMIRINSEFTGIHLDFAENSSFAFTVEAEMSDFDFPKDLAVITYLEKEMFELSIKGYIGDAKGESPKLILDLQNANTSIDINK